MQSLCCIIAKILRFLLLRRKQKQKLIPLVKAKRSFIIVSINYQKATTCFVFLINKP